MASLNSASYTPSLDRMESTLMVPPDRGQILGRAAWKPRHVVCGQRELKTASAGRSKEPLRLNSDDMYLSIYKNKGDPDVIYQWPLSYVTCCEVQMIAHRKQGPVLPTLVISISDKERKRRSSRAAGLMSGKETSLFTLWLRTTPEDKQLLLHEWGRFIMSRKIPTSHVSGPMSPISPICPESPVSPTFVNPFNSRTEITRPPSGNTSNRMQHKGSIATQSSRERAVTYSSDSPSLRSKASDLSTPSSIVPGYSTHPFSPVSPDFPSPATTSTLDDCKGEMLDGGWSCSNKGRSSVVNSPTRRRESLDQRPNVVDSSSPPVPGETILDRAFNMRMVPGSERMIPGEEKLSSIARFEALMSEAEVKRKDSESKQKAEEELAMRSKFINESTDDDDEQDDLEDGHGPRKNLGALPGDGSDAPQGLFPRSGGSLNQKQQRHTTMISPKAQRALDFITSRHEEPDLCNPLSSPFTHTNSLPYRPQTGYNSRRPTISSRTQSQPHSFFQQNAAETAPLRQSAFPRQQSARRPSTTVTDRRQSETHASISTRPSMRSLPPPPPSGPLPTVPASSVPLTTTNIPIDTSPSTSTVTPSASEIPSSPSASSNGNGTSTTSAKRLSFTDFTKRLSTTSSLLLVQSNVSVCNSSTGSRTSTEIGDHQSDDEYVGQQLSHRQISVPPPRPPRKRDTVDCGGFRGGMIPADGGFF